MTMSRPRHPLAAGAGLAAAAGLLVLAACEMPRPTEVSPAGEMPLASIRSGGAYTVSGQVTPAAVREAVAAVLKDSDATAPLGTPVMLYFVADASGRVVHAEYQRQRSVTSYAPSRSRGADAGRGEVRVRMNAAVAGGATASRVSVRGTPMPGAVASIDPAAIGSIEVLKAKPGEIVADSASVIWLTLKEGATLESARVTGAARSAGQVRVDTVRVEALAVVGHAAARGGAAVVSGSGGTPRASQIAPLHRDAGTVVIQHADSSISQVNAPLYVVDGVVIAREKADTFMRDLSPDRIESVEVVKGAAAERLWGERGANGVIQITLKKK